MLHVEGCAARKEERCFHREARTISCRKNRSRASGTPCGSVLRCSGVSCRDITHRCPHREEHAISCRKNRSRASGTPCGSVFRCSGADAFIEKSAQFHAERTDRELLGRLVARYSAVVVFLVLKCRRIAGRCLHRVECAISCRKNRSRASGMPCGSVFGRFSALPS